MYTSNNQVNCNMHHIINSPDHNTQTMICSAPAIETINATVTITNAAGGTASQSASAG